MSLIFMLKLRKLGCSLLGFFSNCVCCIFVCESIRIWVVIYKCHIEFLQYSKLRSASSPSPNDRADQSSLRRQLPFDVQREKTRALSVSFESSKKYCLATLTVITVRHQYDHLQFELLQNRTGNNNLFTSSFVLRVRT